MSEIRANGGFYQILPYLSLVLLVCIIGVYFGNLFFGSNSLSVLLTLRDKEDEIRLEVERVMNENAKLQKDFFELKGLEPK